MARSMVAELGYRPLALAMSGEEAVALARREQPHLVLMDIGLPGEMDGIEAARQIGQEMDVPIVYVTGHSDPATVAQARQTTPYGYLSKPYDRYSLGAAIETALYKHEADQRLRQSEANLAALLENSDDHIWSVDRQYRWMHGNSAFFRHLEASIRRRIAPGESVLLADLDPGLLAEWQSYYDRALGGETFSVETQTHFITPPRYIDYRFTPIRDPRGAVTGVAIAGRDLTHRKQAENALRESEARYRELVEASPNSVLVVQEGRYVYANPAARRTLGYATDELIGMPALALIHPDSYALIQKHLRNAEQGGHNPTLEVKVVCKDFSTLVVESTSVPVQYNGRPAVMVMGQDITEKVQTMLALRRSNTWLELALEGAKADNWDMNLATGELHYNDHWAASLGYAPGEVAPTIQDITKLIHPDDTPANWRDMQNYIEGRTPIYETECRLRNKAGEWVWIVSRGQAVEWDADGRPIRLIGANFDISERKHREEALQQSQNELARAQQIAHLANYSWDVQQNVTTWSDELFRITGCEGRQASYDLMVSLLHPEDRQRVIEAGRRSHLGQEPFDQEYRIVRPDGAVRWLHDQAIVERETDGTPLQIFGTVQDITERKLNEQMLRAALAEKDTLLKEVHHRVKNNLTVIVGLLSLQAAQMADPAARQALQESQQRVLSMAMVHEDLYRSSDLAQINFGKYLRDLAGRLASSYLNGEQVWMHMETEDISLPLEKAIPGGMLVNELLTNAFKHAFPGGRSGEVWLALQRQEDGKIRLAVADNGVGLPPGLDFTNATSLGAQIVTMLARQLGGRLSVKTGEGATFEVIFETTI